MLAKSYFYYESGPHQPPTQIHSAFFDNTVKPVYNDHLMGYFSA